MSRVKKEREKKSFIIKPVWLALLLIAFVCMILLSLGVLALKIGNFLPENTDVIFLVPKDPSFETGDRKGVWETQTRVDIFSSSYVNGENQTTVLSQNGDNLIAPGTRLAYRFCAYNDGNMAMAYELVFSFSLSLGGSPSAAAFPLLIRLSRANGEYLAGNEESFLPLPSKAQWGYEGILGASSYEEFTLEIEWAFEGHDELDTALGIGATKVPVDLQFNVESFAQTHSDPMEKGGMIVAGEKPTEYGGQISWTEYTLLVTLTLVLAAYTIWIA